MRRDLDSQSGALNGHEDENYVVTTYTNTCDMRDPATGIVDKLKSFLTPVQTLESQVVRLENEHGPDSAQETAKHAFATMHLPDPQPYVSVSYWRNNPTPYTVVRGHTWFATEPETFKPQTKRVQAGNAWVEVTATPVGLRFTPGGDEGNTQVYCDGPGVRQSDINPSYHYTYAPWRSKPPNSNCSYNYTRTSPGDPDGPLTSTLEIRWRITWTANGRTSGTLPDYYTEATSTYAVTELQSLVTK